MKLRFLALVAVGACGADAANGVSPDAAPTICSPVETAVPNAGWMHVPEGTARTESDPSHNTVAIVRGMARS